MEKFAHMIQTEVEEESWKPFCLTRKGTVVSHLFFADDSVLFCSAKEAECQKILDIFGYLRKGVRSEN